MRIWKDIEKKKMKFYVKNSSYEGSEVYSVYKEVFDCYNIEVLYDMHYFSKTGYLVIEFNSLEDILEFELKISNAIKNRPKKYSWEIKRTEGIIITNARDNDLPKMNYPTIEIYDNYRE